MTLANKYVDDVVIGAPYEVTQDMIKSLNIMKVIAPSTAVDPVLPSKLAVDPYRIAKEKGIYEEVVLDNKMTIDTIIERVAMNKEKHEAKFKKQKGKQDRYYTEMKQFMAEV